jgi:hypothetical protein
MAVYKVPQDVEADDKLIGPFSFRQFIYLIIVALAIAIGWGLSQLFAPLAIIVLPVIVFFGALALPLRKDQPMEIYLAALVSYHLKPRKRLWQPDGIQSLVEITAPKLIEVQRSKDLSQTEAQQRLSYLANIVDTGGWAVRGVDEPMVNTPMRNDVYFAAQQTEDILDSSGNVAQSFETMIGQADAKRHQDMIDRMKQPVPPAPAAPPAPNPYATLPTVPVTPPVQPTDPHLTFNPYPSAIHQTVINPLGQQPAPAPAAAAPQPAPVQSPPITTSETPTSPGIINLANNPDLSIETIAREAQRIHQQENQLPEEEVVISLR